MKTDVRLHTLRRRETHAVKTGVRRPAFRGPSSTQDRTRVFGPSPSFGWSLKALKRLHCRSGATPYATAESAAEATAAVPALPVDIAIATAYATRILVALLCDEPWRRYFDHGEQRGNVTFLGLQPDWWMFEEPLERLTYQVERQPDCPCCKHVQGKDEGI